MRDRIRHALALSASAALIVVATIAAIELSVWCQGCTPGERAIARTVIDAALATCIVEHADVEDEAALRQACRATEEFGPEVRDFIRARRAGMAGARLAAARCGPDGGK